MAKKRAKPPAKRKAKARTKSRTAAKSSRAPKAKTAPAKRKPRRPDPLDVLVDASARALALPLERSWRSGIKSNLAVTLRLAALFADFPLPDDAEPAPVFVA
jgi:hypothetical protein